MYRIAIFIVFLTFLSITQAQQIDRVEPSQGTPDAATRVTLVGENFDPLTRIDLDDGGPHEIARLSLNGLTPSVQVVGDRAYVSFIQGTEKRGGVYVIDISDPYAPTLIGDYGPSDGTQGYSIAVEDNIAFVGFFNIYVFDGGIFVVNLDDETAPTLNNTFTGIRFPISMKCHQERLYIADLSDGLTIVDISDPSEPSTLSSLAIGNFTWDVAVEENMAYVAAGALGMVLVDVSNPQNPVVTSQIAPPVSPGSFDNGTLGVAVQGGYAFMADARDDFKGLTVVDVRDPVAPRIVGQHATPIGARSVEVHDGVAYLTDGVGGLQMLDVTDPTTPKFLGGAISLGFSGDYGDFEVSNGYAYIADQQIGLRVLDLSGSAPKAIAQQTLDSAAALVRHDHLGYVGDKTGLRIFDLVDPADPALLREIPGDAVNAITLSHDFAVVADTAGLNLMSIQEPANPQLLGTLPMAEMPIDVALKEDLVAAVDESSATFIDWSDPSNPITLGRCASREFACRIRDARGIALHHEYAYIAADFAGLHVVDLTDPLSPRRTRTIRTAHRATGIVIRDELAYVSIGNLGIAIFDLSQPDNPQQIQTVATKGFASGVKLDGDTMIVANGIHGVELFDLTEPTLPKHRERIDTPGDVVDAALFNQYVAIADGIHGLMIAVRNPKPLIHSVQADQVEVTVPEGYQPGSYHVIASNPTGIPATLFNGFRICPDAEFAAALHPSLTNGSAVQWTLNLEGDRSLTQDPANHDAWLELPEFTGETQVEFIHASFEGLTIDLFTAETGPTLVILSGSDENYARSTWEEIFETGQIALSPLGDEAYGPFRLSRASRRGAGIKAMLPNLLDSQPVTAAGVPRNHYRFRLLRESLISASASGRNADLSFGASAADDSGCGADATVSAVESIAAFCATLAGSGQNLKFQCPVAIPSDASVNPRANGRVVR